jgi:membrane-associated phospholipid phosphatase
VVSSGVSSDGVARAMAQPTSSHESRKPAATAQPPRLAECAEFSTRYLVPPHRLASQGLCIVGGGVAGRRVGPGRPLLAGSARPWAGGLLACCAIVVTVLGVAFAHQARADWLDHAVDSVITSWLGGHRDLLLWLAAPGSQLPVVVATAAIVVGCLLGGRLNGALLALAAVPVASGLAEGLVKPLVHRTDLGAVSYPSGHTTAMFALAGTLAVLLVRAPPGRARALRVLIPAAACVLGGVVAVALIGLRWHYFTDTVAGAAVGIGTVCGLALLLDLPACRRWLAWACREPPASAERRGQAAQGSTQASA